MRVVFAVLAAAIVTATVSPARAENWCGFIDKDHSQMRCGFSSLHDCKQAVGDKKDAYCMPDPEFAGWERVGERLAANRF
jgi:Protein of unknown function (DUF3551)